MAKSTTPPVGKKRRSRTSQPSCARFSGLLRCFFFDANICISAYFNLFPGLHCRLHPQKGIFSFWSDRIGKIRCMLGSGPGCIRTVWPSMVLLFLNPGLLCSLIFFFLLSFFVSPSAILRSMPVALWVWIFQKKRWFTNVECRRQKLLSWYLESSVPTRPVTNILP